MKRGGLILKGAYFDSVTLMGIGRELSATPGVLDASVVMGTDTNRSILKAAGLMIPAFDGADDMDLLIAVKAKSATLLDQTLARAEAALKKKPAPAASSASRPVATSIETAAQTLPGANLALISVAGTYAAEEARKALETGLHVMLFSDNVSIESEVELKRLAKRKELLLMGPDAGTAIINGVPLAFANVVARGPVGIVAASGTGAQEVSSLVSNHGAGISQLIGVGGRDVKRQVGGIMFLEALKALIADPQTKVIVLVSKPPDPVVLAKIQHAASRTKKPIVCLFLGAPTREGEPHTLEEAAALAAALAQGRSLDSAWAALEQQRADLAPMIDAGAAALPAGGRYVRGLFSGGTFCAEAQVILAPLLGKVYSNAPTGEGMALKDSGKSQGHCFIDFGEDEFTRGRPHPMIDFTLRNERIHREAADPQTALILLDVVLGYGAHADPASELAPAIRDAARKVPVLCSVTGTDRDPQNWAATIDRLRRVGALVAPSNAAACWLAGEILHRRGKKRSR